jgi:two-component system, LytTR family, sensor histidine kinase AlgZ
MPQKPPLIIAPISLLKNRLIIHSIFVSVVLIALFFSYFQEFSRNDKTQYYVLLDFIETFTFCYLFILILIPKMFYNSRVVLYTICGISLSFFWSFITINTTQWAYAQAFPEIDKVHWSNAVGTYFLLFFMVTGLKLGKDLLIVQHENEIAQRQKVQQELTFLRSQLSPHFLLNTMNNLYGLSVVKSDDLPKLILRLSDLLRFTIYDTKDDLVNLKDEVQYLTDYIELQKIRMNDKVDLQIDFPTELPSNKQIVPLVLVVFVENAFKHSQNVLSKSNRYIHFTISIEANYLYFLAENSYCQVSANQSVDSKEIQNDGIGIENTKRRIELLCGTESIPKIEKENGKYQVQIKLKLHEKA